MKYKFLLGLVIIFFPVNPVFSQEYNDEEIALIIRRITIEADQNMAELLIEGDISIYDERFPIDFISIAKLNKNQLRILRNLIYARYGYVFKSEDLRDYFSQFE